SGRNSGSGDLCRLACRADVLPTIEGRLYRHFATGHVASARSVHAPDGGPDLHDRIGLSWRHERPEPGYVVGPLAAQHNLRPWRRDVGVRWKRTRVLLAGAGYRHRRLSRLALDREF